MPRIQICHDLLQKVVNVHDGCHLDIIQQEVLKRFITITGLPKIQCVGEFCGDNEDHALYLVAVKAPTGVPLFHLWVRWYEDDEGYE